MSVEGHTHNYSPINHTHSGYAASTHNHSATQITSGTLPVARGGTGQTTIDGLKSALGLDEISTSTIKTEWGVQVVSSDQVLGTGKSFYPSSALNGKTFTYSDIPIIQGTNGRIKRIKLKVVISTVFDSSGAWTTTGNGVTITGVIRYGNFISTKLSQSGLKYGSFSCDSIITVNDSDFGTYTLKYPVYVDFTVSGTSAWTHEKTMTVKTRCVAYADVYN